MSRHRLELLLWSAAALLAASAAIRATRRAPGGVHTATGSLGTTGSIESPLGDSVMSMAARIASANPFRLSRRPADVPYDAQLDGAPAPPVLPPAPRPAPVLTGVVGGPPWEAVIEGLAGREGGVVVREGDVLGDLRVRRVGPDVVVIQGVDTTWKLTVRRP